MATPPAYSSSELRTRAVVLGGLLAVGGFPVALVALRVNQFDALTYSFIVWNLFLAAVPVVFAVAAELADRGTGSRALVAVLLAGWLLFFPNAPYLTTDLIHLEPRPPAPLWLDALILGSAAVAGLLAGFVSLHIVQETLAGWWGRFWAGTFSLGVLALASFGIYLGRFGRYNSWDVLTCPRDLLYDVSDQVSNPFSYPRTVAVTFLFTCFQVAAYVVIRWLGRITRS